MRHSFFYLTLGSLAIAGVAAAACSSGALPVGSDNNAPHSGSVDASACTDVSCDTAPNDGGIAPVDAAKTPDPVDASLTTCVGPNPAGCVENGCPSGQTCAVRDKCVSSTCSCDSASKVWQCTPDCSGGECVAQEDAGAATCNGIPNPAGCINKGCGKGQTCRQNSGVCVSSSCTCMDGAWNCTPDCGGGICD